MHNAGLKSISSPDELDPMLKLSAIEDKELELSQLDFLPLNTIIPGSDLPSVMSEVVAEGLRDPFYAAVRSLVLQNFDVKAGPPKTTSRIIEKATDYKEEYDKHRDSLRSKNYRDSFTKLYKAEPVKPLDFVFQVCDLARVNVTFKTSIELTKFVESVEKSDLFEILSITNLFRESL